MSAQLFPILFARNLFLPRDLGGNRYPYETMRRLGERGYPVTVVTPRLHANFPSLPGVRYRCYPISRRHSVLTHLTNVAAGTAALYAERGPTAGVALAGSYDSAVALDLAGVAPARVPLIFLFHSEFYSEWVQALGHGPRALASRAIHAYMAAIERRVFQRATRLVAVSAYSARQMRERWPAAADRIRQVSTGVDTAYFVPAASRVEARQALGMDVDEPLFLGVGRLVGVKQFDRLIRGLALARAQGMRARLAIAGDGPDRPALERLIHALNLGDSVRLAGFCEPPQLRQWMQAADAQVASSAFENFSLAILEAFSCGLPVLSTPGGGLPEQVGMLDPSLVLPDDTPETLAAGLLEWSQRPEDLRVLGQRARQIAVERFDWERVVDQLAGVCAEVAG